MARTNLPVSVVPVNGSLADPAGTAIDQANGMNIAGPLKLRRLLIRVKNAAAGSQNLIVRAGVYPPALASGQGDLTVACPGASAITWAFVPDSGRYLQKDGSINIDFNAGTTGNITAFVGGSAAGAF